MKIGDIKKHKIILESIYEHTSSSKWVEVKYLKWDTSEVMDVMSKALDKYNKL
jgi:hypothetical protein